MNEWFVVLNRVEARFYKRSTLFAPLKLVQTIQNPLGRERNKQMKYGRPGNDRFRTKNAIVSHALSGEKNPHEDAAVQFVRKVASALESQRNKHRFEKLTIIADPHMCGLLNQSFGKTIRAVSISWIKKNLSKLPDNDINLFIQKKQKQESIYEVQ